MVEFIFPSVDNIVNGLKDLIEEVGRDGKNKERLDGLNDASRSLFLEFGRLDRRTDIFGREHYLEVLQVLHDARASAPNSRLDKNNYERIKSILSEHPELRDGLPDCLREYGELAEAQY